MSNKTDQSSSKAKAGVAATRALAGILSPEAAIAAASLSTPAATEAPNAPTSMCYLTILMPHLSGTSLGYFIT